jgi:photosystem II stability/assembly factor-like uncharacterized protein
MTKPIGMKYLSVWVALWALTIPAISQVQYHPFDNAVFDHIEWRNIGPFRGGRCGAVAGLPNDPLTYYMGSTGGGVWKTQDAGLSWSNISDGFFDVGSIGAIAVAPSDPNVIYVGTGEHAIRGVMTSHGNGIYRSLDAGKTWAHFGLKDSRHIASIQIHPQRPNVLLVAVQGAAHGPSEERGVYRSTDGGTTWQRVLYINNTTGASDLSMDIHNPRILYAALWDHMRAPWQIRSGGEGSGIYKSIDGGLNWVKLSKGLPAEMGKTGIAVSPANPKIVYAIIEGKDGGVYRSNDGGESWEYTCPDRTTIARAWYYTEIVPDPIDAETVYVLNAPLLKSVDGGRTFESIPNPHSDQHALWINPSDNRLMILGNDGGATITLNEGKSWSTQANQPTAQFYRVIADNRFPYYLYAGQQDNSTIAIPNQTLGAGISSRDWYPVAGGESAFLAFDPDHPNLIYGGSYQGNLSVYDSQTKSKKDIMAYPSLGLGKVPAEMLYRFNWNSPLVIQPQNPDILYHAANMVLRSENGGFSWEAISPDLTRNEKEKQGKGGVPYTNEGAGGENYNTISYMACSADEAGVIWVGSDDGLLHMTRDEGQNWENITPPSLEEALINCIELSPHQPGEAYVVATRYKFDDFKPMAFYTSDYGQSWSSITNGIRKEDFLRVIRADLKKPGLLYAGAETGFYISFNNGKQWHHLQLNLPVCPINDLTIKNNDLIAATSGRAFWVLDNLSPFQQSEGHFKERPVLFDPSPAYRFSASTPEETPTGIGQNPPNGVIIDYFLPEDMDSSSVSLRILDDRGEVIRQYSNQEEEDFETYKGGPKPERLIPTKTGINRFNWDLRRATLKGIPGVFVLGQYQGSLVAPGKYTIELVLPQKTLSTTCTVLADPRLTANDKDYEAQQEILLAIEQNVRAIHQAVTDMRDIKDQMSFLQKNLKKAGCTQDLLDAGDSIVTRIQKWEEQLIQPQQKTFQDVINFPNRLSADLLNLKQRVDSHDPRVTTGATKRLADLLQEWTDFELQMREILERDVVSFNKLYTEYKLPAIVAPLGAE